jgi:hypothetical protein
MNKEKSGRILALKTWALVGQGGGEPGIYAPPPAVFEKFKIEKDKELHQI